MVNVAATHELSKTFPSPKRKFIVSVMLYNAYNASLLNSFQLEMGLSFIFLAPN